MATAVISSPDTMPGSHRSCWASSACFVKYGSTMSVCRDSDRPALDTAAYCASSTMIALNRKSSTPAPPNRSGAWKASSPCAPAAVNSDRSTIPASSQRSWWGTTSRS